MKKLTSILILFICLFALTVAVNAVDIWDGTVEQPKEVVKIDGEYWFKISKCSELAWFGTSTDTTNYKALLTDDLILNTYTFKSIDDDEIPDSLYKWKKIKLAKLDGAGHTISGIYMPKEGNYASFSDCYCYNLNLNNVYICGKDYVSGVSSSRAESCSISGFIKGIDHVSGITNYGTIWYCKNYATVYGGSYVSGISSPATSSMYYICGCENYGVICGTRYVSGICSLSDTSYNIENCCNHGLIIATEGYCGGIVDAVKRTTIKNCYNTGYISCEMYAGSIAGKYDYINYNNDYKFTTDVFYLSGQETYGSGSYLFDIEEYIAPKTKAELTDPETFKNWDWSIWAMDENINEGMPYIRNCGVRSESLQAVYFENEKEINLYVGDSQTISFGTVPYNVEIKEIEYSSSDADVAVVNETGLIEAVNVGECTITVIADGKEISTKVTVNERGSNEYRVEKIKVKENNFCGNVVSVVVTKLENKGDAKILLASYDKNGKFVNVVWFEVEDVEVGSKFTFSIGYKKAEVGMFRAFIVGDMGSWQPIGEAGVLVIEEEP